MFAFRALFWFCVVCAVVPFKHFDLATGEIKVDRAELMSRLSSLPSYCEDHRDVCKQARIVFAQAARGGAEAARHFAGAVQGRDGEI